MTYGQRFDEYLYDAIRAGGEVDRICVLAVAFLRNDHTVRAAAFRDWVAGEHFQCGRCRADFSAYDHAVGEDDEVVCVWCLKGYRTGLEPVPGFRATFARSR